VYVFTLPHPVYRRQEQTEEMVVEAEDSEIKLLVPLTVMLLSMSYPMSDKCNSR
jgi:hypothetical protein